MPNFTPKIQHTQKRFFSLVMVGILFIAGIATTLTGLYSIFNTGQVSPGSPESRPEAQVSTDCKVSFTVESADLSITKTVSNENPIQGSQVTFTIRLTNAGPSEATNVTVSDFLSPGLGFVSGTASQGSYDASTGIWQVGILPATREVTLTIVANVNTAGQITNFAEVMTSDQPDPDSTPGNHNPNEDDQKSVTFNSIVPTGSIAPTMTAAPTGAPNADLSLTKRASSGSVVVGESFVYTLQLLNSGPNAATNVQVRDLLPSTVTFQSARPSQGSYNASTGIWTVGTVSVNTTVQLELTVIVNAQGGQTNAAEVIASDQRDGDSTPNNGRNGEDDYAETQTGVATLPKAGATSGLSTFLLTAGGVILLASLGLLLLL